MRMARPDKTEAVKEIAARFKESEGALLTEYRGLRVGEIAEVRRALREADADYKVLKNTLTRLAVREVGLEDLVGMLEGPTAIAFFKGDAAAAAKALDDASKKFPVLTVKGGVLNGKFLDADQAQQLAKLEPREVQLAKIAMLMNAPAQSAVNVFAALLRDLGSMLAQVIAQKEADSDSTHGDTDEPAEPEPADAEHVEAEPAEAVQEDAVQEEAEPTATEQTEVEQEEAEKVEEDAKQRQAEQAETEQADAERPEEE
jgi:large subunit ribosomal protein L10